jgi:acyl carrier protein
MSQLDEIQFKTVVIRSLNLPVTDYRETLSLGDVGEWDSLGHLSQIFGIESAYGVKFPMESIPELRSLGAIREALVKKGAK